MEAPKPKLAAVSVDSEKKCAARVVRAEDLAFLENHYRTRE